MNSTRSISRAGWQARQTFKKVETLCEKEMCQVWKARIMKEELRMKERGRQNGLATRHVQEEAPVRGTRRHFITRAASHYLRVTWAHWHTHTHTLWCGTYIWNICAHIHICIYTAVSAWDFMPVAHGCPLWFLRSTVERGTTDGEACYSLIGALTSRGSP